jgi:hypothetical protein
MGSFEGPEVNPSSGSYAESAARSVVKLPLSAYRLRATIAARPIVPCAAASYARSIWAMASD